MKVGAAQAERREVDYVRLENVPESGIDVTFNGVVRAADKTEQKDYFIQVVFPDDKTRELGIDESTINHTNLVTDLGGEDTDKWKKGSILHLSRGTVKNGKYAGNPFIAVSVK